MKERWVDIKGFEGMYRISNMGNIKSLKNNKEKILKPYPQNSGYLIVGLMKNNIRTTKLVHRLVIEHYLLKPANKITEANHINGNKYDNRIENLEWVTRRENQNHAVRNGMIKSGANDWRSKPVLQMDDDGNIIAEFVSQKDASKKTGIRQGNISSNCNGDCKHAGGYVWKYK